MARNGRHECDDDLILALAGGKTVGEAAVAVKVSPRTVHRRMGDPRFRRRVEDARAARFEMALGILADGLTEACDAVRSLLKSDSDQVKLGATRTLFDMTLRLRESLSLERRLSEIERRLDGDGRDGPESGACQPDFALNGDGLV